MRDGGINITGSLEKVMREDMLQVPSGEIVESGADR